MGLLPKLVSTCLVAEGFPQNICPSEVAGIISWKTGVTLNKIAPITDPVSGISGWLLLLRSHDDQKKCLLNFRSFEIQHGNNHHRILLNYPEISLTPHVLNWICIEKEDEMNSYATEDMFGDDDEENTEIKEKWTVFSSAESKGRQVNTFSDVQGQNPPNVRQTPELHSATPHQPQHNPFQSSLDPAYYHGGQERQKPTRNSLGMDSSLLSECDPLEARRPHVQGNFSNRQDIDDQRQPIFPQSHFIDHGRGLMMNNHGRGSSQFSTHSAIPAHDSNPIYSTGAAPSQTGIGELNLRMEPFPYYRPTDHEHEAYYDTCTSPEDFDHSDFMVIGSPSHSGSNHRFHFYLRVTNLPNLISEQELLDFFQNRSLSGGGTVSKIELNSSQNSASIFFLDGQVIDRVMQQAPFLLKNVMIRVEAVSVENQQEEQIRTIEVRGLKSEEETEKLMYYFENPTKGGGDIESIEWKDQEKIFLITFKDPEVARSVTSRGHTLGNMVLEVCLYEPPTDASSDTELQCTVEVRGFDPDPEKKELYDFYFSNPKKGGGNIVRFEISDDRSVMHITFETPEVAQRVANMSHIVGGHTLDVGFAPVEDSTPPDTIIVKACDLSKKDLYHVYFENPRSGGGDITKFDVDRSLQAIVITFADPEVAKAVASKEHKVGGVDLEISLFTKKMLPKGQKSKEETEEEEETPPRTVILSAGQYPVESEDTYIYYFESSRHGGGEVEDVTVDEEKKLVHITFVEHTVAARVAAQQHKICGHNVDVKLYIPPKPRPTYPDKLLLKNVADSTSRECLSMYLEHVTGQEPTEIIYGDEVGTVLVTFKDETDFADIQLKCQRPLEKRILTVSKVPISNCILVENLAKVTSEDTVTLYFENSRSKGGPVEKVDMVPEENKCFVYFQSHEVLDGVLSRRHKIDGSELVVKRYIECLGQSGGSEDPTAFVMPNPFRLDNIDTYKIAFLRHCQAAKQGFLQELSSNHAVAVFEGNIIAVNCTLSLTVPKARILAQSWHVDVRQCIVNYFELIGIQKRQIMQQIWQEVKEAVKTVMISCPGVMIIPFEEETTFIVVGMSSMVKEVYAQICSTIKDKEDEIERRNMEITESNYKVKPFQLRLLLAMGFHIHAGKRHEGLEVDIQIKKKCIVFHGLMKDVKESQVEMFEALQSVRSEKIKKMTELQKRVLEAKETNHYIVQKFKNAKIIAVWELDQQSDITVFAFNDKALVKAIHIINQSVQERVCPLHPQSSQLLSCRDWQVLMSCLTSTNPGVLQIVPSSDNLQLFITCTDNIMHGIVEEVEKFMMENTVYSQLMCFSPNRQLFWYYVWATKMKTIVDNLQGYQVQLTLEESGSKISAKGTREGLRKVKESLELLNGQIIYHKEIFTDQKMIKVLSSSNTKDLVNIGRACRCVLALKQEAADLQILESDSHGAVSPTQVDGSGNAVAGIKIRDNINISVVHGDITQMSVAAIVNAANSRMDHIGGLAREIVNKGGEAIQSECYAILKEKGCKLKEGDILVSGSGQLPCKAIIHAVGPVYKGGYSGEQDCLFETVMKCMRKADKAGYSSIAFPAISTGIFGYPLKESTLVIVEAVKAFFDGTTHSTVKDVFLCHPEKEYVKFFSAALKKIFPHSSLPSDDRKPKPAPRGGPQNHGVRQPNIPAAIRPGLVNSGKVIKVSIIAGEIAKQSVDVIVNSTSNGLDLQNGAVSSSILKAAGPGLQTECKLKYPHGVQVGDIARTSGHGLKCAEVFHVVLCNYTNPSAQQTLNQIVTECLTVASKQRYESLAFPVLGTGNLAFPGDVAAQTMLDAIGQFEATIKSTSLKTVMIVVYPADKKNLQEFQSRNASCGVRPKKVMLTHQAKAKGTRFSRVFSEEASSSSNKPGGSEQDGSKGQSISNTEFDIGGLRFIIKHGDITEEDTDAIVNSTNASLDLTRGGVANALRKKCGPQLEDECKRKVTDIQKHGIVQTKTYNMKSKIIFHVDADHFGSKWEEGIELCLKHAENSYVQSIAMPAFGTGLGMSSSSSAVALFNAVVKMYKHGNSNGSVQEIRVVLFDKQLIPPFVTAIQHIGEKKNNSKKGFFNSIKSAIFGSSPEVRQKFTSLVMEEATLFIYAEKKSDVDEALKLLDEMAKEKFTRKEYYDEVITKLETKNIEAIHQIGLHHNVELQIYTVGGRIIGDGLHKNVYECMEEIGKVIRELERNRQASESAAMLANMIQWCFLEVTNTGTEQREYGPKENHIIELAFQKKDKSARLVDHIGAVYVVDFDSMIEYPEADPTDVVSVIRRDKIKDLSVGQVPDFWEAHSTNETVKLVPLKANDQEYQTVENGFKASVGNFTIKTIDRVQNPHLYHQYVAKKAHMEKQNPGIQNEKTLWHGTASEAIDNINHHGFNRSFCGKNATVYGQGVYFAVNASYSASSTYSPADISGNRYVYQCKVLAGHTTLGNTNLRVLPPRQGSILYDSATDNVQNPSMFVIFHDTQAYPEYLLTF